MIKNLVKKKLKNNSLSLGSWLTIGHPNIVEIMANAGFEWLVVDLEHTAIDLSTTQVLISTIQSRGMTALVRVAKNEEVMIKKVLDMGADGIIVPMINSQADAKDAVGFSKYPPEGKRGVGLYRAQNYGLDFEKYKTWVTEELIIIAQIEHRDAVSNIEDIISVPGIDGIMIGPYDLSGSLGIPGELENPEVLKEIEKVKEACRKNNFPYGHHIVNSDAKKITEKMAEGCTFLAYGTDYLFMGDAARQGMRQVQDA